MNRVIINLFILIIFLSAPVSYGNESIKTHDYVHWLIKNSMLYQANKLIRKNEIQAFQWQHPYTRSDPNLIVKKTSVWFDAYPKSILTNNQKSKLAYLSEEKLWNIFQDLGINALHTGPMKMAGGLVGKQFTKTIDGGFDRINYSIFKFYGSENEYEKMVMAAHDHRAVIIGDIIPGHTGKGPDFRLAERNVLDYPGLYTMVEIKRKDWKYLPEVFNLFESKNLDVNTVKLLTEKGYIPGMLQHRRYNNKNIHSAWDVTGIIKGVDGKARRWVYLHYYRSGQPTMNWLDPSFAAQRLIAGDVIKSLIILGDKGLRIDANAFLGIEIQPHQFTAWSEKNPFSMLTSDIIANLIRKLGGWSYQELNRPLNEIKAYSKQGADLSYDFVTRTGLIHALLTGNTSLLRLKINLLLTSGVDPKILVHSLQNHDQLNYELVEFTENPKKYYRFNTKLMKGEEIQQKILDEMKEKIKPIPYLKIMNRGICSTFSGIIAGRLGIKNYDHINSTNIENIKKAMLLAVVFNAMQPGILNISGWDLVGALPLLPRQIPQLISDGDCRWLNRGSYDLLGDSDKVNEIPKVRQLFGSLIQQKRQNGSFYQGVKKIVQIRKKYHLSTAKLLSSEKLYDVFSDQEDDKKGLLILTNQIKNKKKIIVILNFNNKTIEGNIQFDKQYKMIDLLTNKKMFQQAKHVRLVINPFGSVILYPRES